MGRELLVRGPGVNLPLLEVGVVGVGLGLQEMNFGIRK